MKSISVLLNTTDSVKKFVSVISQCPYEIDLRSGRYVVDAKSILGIFSLNLNRPVVLEIYDTASDDEYDDFIKKIGEFITK
ncbi:MAG: HPr family phosphocarrier protein [Clostridia bacterium]